MIFSFRSIFIAIPFLFAGIAFPQSVPDTLKGWEMGGTGTLNFSQVALSNWVQGGENSISATALFNLFANFSNDKSTFDNMFDIAYGFLQSGNSALRKSDDKIEFSSKYGYKTSSKWFLATVLSLKSQITRGYNYPNDSVIISDFLAPGYITISTGMEYKLKNNFSFFMSPVTGKITLVNNQILADAGAYGVTEALFDTAGVQTVNGKKIRYEFGSLISVKFKKGIAKNITFSTKVDFFSNYFNNPENIDINWDGHINMKVNKFVSAIISATLIYDHDIPVPIYTYLNGVKTQTSTGPRTQFKEVFAVGFSYKF